MQDQGVYAHDAGRRAVRRTGRGLPPDDRGLADPRLGREPRVPGDSRAPLDPRFGNGRTRSRTGPPHDGFQDGFAGRPDAPERRGRGSVDRRYGRDLDGDFDRGFDDRGFDRVAGPDTGPDLYGDRHPGGRRSRRQAAPAPSRPQEDLPPDDPPRGHRRKDKGGGKRMKVLAWASVVMTGVMVAGTLGGYAVYRSALSQFRTEDVNAKLGNDRPVNSTGALNVLLVGSDTREGDNLKYGPQMQNAGKRTDTMILMHISPNRDNATLVSFPRDSVVQIPACEGDNGQQIPPRVDLINSAYNQGGIACTIRTLESLTDIRIDHFVEVDFTGFKNIVNALGGIRVCLKQPVNDNKAKLNLSAGWHTLKGEAALGYVRLRNYGNGSDIERIKRQQVFLREVVKKATSSDLLTNPTKLYNFITTAARSVTMDPELANNTETLIQIAQSARSLTASGVQFITVPWGPHPDDENRVIWKQPQADNLFQMIRNDVEVKPTTTPKPTASAKASNAPQKPTIKPEDVRIQVLNGTNVSGRATTVAEALAAQGFNVVEVGDAQLPGADRPETKLLYPKNAEFGADYAAPVAAKLLNEVKPTSGRIQPTKSEPYVPDDASGEKNAGKKKADKGGKTPLIQLVIGADWEGVKAPVRITEDLKQNVVDEKTDPCQ